MRAHLFYFQIAGGHFGLRVSPTTADCKMPHMKQNDRPLPEGVRAQLLALGIPPAQHTPDGIAGLFPPEFNIRATELDAEDLARVLIHLAERKIIALPGSASRAPFRKVGPGWHFCQFYRDFNQLLDLVAPYIAEGLRNGESCLWVTPDAVTHEAACDTLGRLVDDVDARLASGQLEILAHPTWYLDPTGRLKSFEEIGAGLIDRQDRALAKGFKFLRAAGDSGWVSGTEQSRAFIDYEMKVNAAIGATKVAAVCTYRADVTASELVDIVTAHQDAAYADGELAPSAAD